MKRLNIYLKEWRDAAEEADRLLKEGDFKGYENMMNKAGDIAIEYNNAKERMCECTNYGISSYLFENALPYLFKKDKKTIRRAMNLIKEDKNLKGEFSFIKALENFNNELDPKEYVSEALSMVETKINKKTLKESNSKFGKIVSDAEIIPDEKISDEKLAFFESCDYLLTHSKGLLNLSKYNTHLKNVAKYISENYNKAINESKDNVLSLVETFDKKYSNLLNEEERDFIKSLTDCTNEARTEKKKALFEKFKNECLKAIDKMLSEEPSETERNGLAYIREQVEEKVYNESTIITDFAKLLEIRDILVDNGNNY